MEPLIKAATPYEGENFRDQEDLIVEDIYRIEVKSSTYQVHIGCRLAVPVRVRLHQEAMGSSQRDTDCVRETIRHVGYGVR